jgi:hypothetical protein
MLPRDACNHSAPLDYPMSRLRASSQDESYESAAQLLDLTPRAVMSDHRPSASEPRHV